MHILCSYMMLTTIINWKKIFTKSIECWIIVLEPPVCFEGPDPSPAFSDRRFWAACEDKALNSSLLQYSHHLLQISYGTLVGFAFGPYFFLHFPSLSLYRTPAICLYVSFTERDRAGSHL